MLLAGVGVDFQENSASNVSPGLLVSLVISSHSLGSRPSPFVYTIASVPGLPSPFVQTGKAWNRGSCSQSTGSWQTIIYPSVL